MTNAIKLFPGQTVRITDSPTGTVTDWLLLQRDKISGTLTAAWVTENGCGRRWNFPNDEFVADDYPGQKFEFRDGYTPCRTVGELKAAIADLPDDMPVGKWDVCGSIMYSQVDGAPSTAYLRDKQGDREDWTIYGGFDPEDPEREIIRKMLVI